MPLSPQSRLSLGGATFGREIDESAAIALLDHAVAHGISHFDTAANYSGGASERIIGRWLTERQPEPGNIFVATKLLPPYSAEAIDGGAAASAARLGVDIIDLLYLHRWDPTVEIASTLVALDRLVRERRVRTLGASNFNTEQLEAALALQASLGTQSFRFLQNIHNFAVQGVNPALRRVCTSHGVTIVTYSPLGAGFLTGKHRAGVQPGSRFAVVLGHQDIYFQPAAMRRLTELSDLSIELDRPMASLALIWALHQPGISSVLVGGRTPAHIDQAVAALNNTEPAVLARLAL